MIIVLSYSNYEQGTEYVLDWLSYYNADFVKITMNEIFSQSDEIEVDVNNEKFIYKGIDILGKVNVIFYRRLFAGFTLLDSNDNIYKSQLEREITDESFTIIHYLFYLFRNKTWLPAPYSANVNKLIITSQAQKHGLRVPKSMIINNKNALLQFRKECNSGIITKPIAKSTYFRNDRYTYFANVNEMTDDRIDEISDQFFPSLFQEKIEREYEIRTFYLDGRFYSIALLYSSAQESIDIKLNKDENHTHWIRYQLPPKFEATLRKFMSSINLNTGSLDIIKTKNGDYVLLEVNPVGQYGHGSYNGNYGLEKIIAEWLIKKDKNAKRN